MTRGEKFKQTVQRLLKTPPKPHGKSEDRSKFEQPKKEIGSYKKKKPGK